MMEQAATFLRRTGIVIGSSFAWLERHDADSWTVAIPGLFTAMRLRCDGPAGATELGMRFNQFDAKVWGFVLMGCLLAATVGCFGLAAAAVQTSTTNGTDVISVSAALRKMEQTRIRQGVMTERVRNGQVEQLVPGALASDAVR
jgi:hypothetical protein